ncbi:phosphoribosyl-AMP cyclohydrolase [Candidatus Vidania fulgoroideorum]
MLIPIIVQSQTKTVLMLAWGNGNTIYKTNKFGYSFFFSRKRKRVWLKGEQSTNFQIIKKIHIDCDKDCLLYTVNQINKICCHKETQTCFYDKYNNKKN